MGRGGCNKKRIFGVHALLLLNPYIKMKVIDDTPVSPC